MSPKRRGGYAYSLEDTPTSSGPRKPEPKKTPSGKHAKWVTAGIILAVLAAMGLFFTASSGSSSLSPFPKELIALQLQLNGKEVILMPGTQCMVNPKDSLQLLQIKTDGWLPWGVRLVSSDLDTKVIRERTVVIRDLWPQESFEKPKTVEIEVQSWKKPIGRVSFLIQLDAKDWLQKANTTENDERKAEFLEKALQENPGNVLVKTQLAGIYFEAKKYNEAVKLYKEVDESGKSKAILEKLLSIYQIQNRVDDALVTYLDLLRLSEDPDVFKQFIQYAQKSKSKEDLGRFLERHQNAIPRAFQSSVHLVLADVSTQTRNWRKAADSYEKVIRAGVKDPDVLYNLAITYQNNNDLDRAIPALERYLQRSPGDQKSWMMLGEWQEKKGAASQARQTFEKLVEKNPQNREALVRLLAILEKTNDKSALQETYEKLAQMNPKDKTVLYNLAVLHYEGKRWPKATEAFEALAAQDPRDVRTRKYLLDLYRKQKNQEAFLKTLQTLSQLEPNNTAYFDELYGHYKDKQDYKGMVAAFREASEKRPDSVTLHKYLLTGLLAQQDKRGAVKELEHLIRLEPKEPKHLRQAANLYQDLGDYGQAAKKIEQLIALKPNEKKQLQEEYMSLRLQSMSRSKPKQGEAPTAPPPTGGQPRVVEKSPSGSHVPQPKPASTPQSKPAQPAAQQSKPAQPARAQSKPEQPAPPAKPVAPTRPKAPTKPPTP